MIDLSAQLWKRIGLESISIRALVISPGMPEIIFAATDGYGVYKSEDAGQTWTPASTGLTDPYIFALIRDIYDPSILYTGTADGIFKSTDRALTWQQVGLSGETVISLAPHPENSASIYAGTHQSGAFRSIDSGANWQAINTGLPDLPITALAVNLADNALIFAGTWGGGVYASEDSGLHWEAFNSGLDHLEVYSLLAAFQDRLYAGTYFGGVQSFYSGAWHSLNQGIRNPYVQMLYRTPLAPVTLFAGTDNGLYSSTDDGEQWAYLLLPDPSVLAVAQSPSDPTRFFIGTSGGVYSNFPSTFEFYLPLIKS